MSADPAKKVATPMGRLMKKIQCQLIHSVSRPPANRPIEPPPAMTNVKTLMACARSPGFGKPVTIKARITPAESAPPAPCTKRAITSSAELWANPLSTEAAVKRTTPARKTFLRPMRSPARPARSSRLP